MSEKTLIQQHAEALEQIKKLTGEREASAKLLEESAKALTTEQAAHKATNEKLAEATRQLTESGTALAAKEIERAAFAEKNEKLAFALAHPSFKALAAAGIAATDLPQQGGQSEDKQEVKQPTAKERYLAMKRDESISPVECAKFYETNKEAIRSGK